MRAREILSAFRGPIEPVQTALTYRLGIMIVAAVMMLLPMLYLALIGVIAWGVYYHAVNHTTIFAATGVRSGKAMIGLAIVYIAPIVAGALTIVFMLKPFFAPVGSAGRTRALSRQGEPLLFAFVDRLCEVVGSPRPVRIEVDCRVNASAGFSNGWRGLVDGKLCLVIGVPLVAGTTLNEIAGVLAHEFGHFTQGAGMRVSYIARSINMWFAQSIYQRDAWDEGLDSAAESLDIRIGIVLHFARLMIWCSRGVLWLLMTFGAMVCSYLMREMEYDADLKSGRLIGPEVFQTTHRRVTQLDWSYNAAMYNVFQLFQRGALPDNVPLLTMYSAKHMTQEIRAQLVEQDENSKTGFFCTHPCHGDRVDAILEDEPQAVFGLPGHATELFTDFRTLSRNVTWDFYCSLFGSRLAPDQMHSVEEMIAAQGEIDTRKASGAPPPPPQAVDDLPPIPLAGDDDDNDAYRIAR